MNNNIFLYKGDLRPEDAERIINEYEYIAVDTETTGLSAVNDKLSLIQIAAGDNFYLIKYDTLDTPANLTKILQNNKLTKVFHHAPFDIAFLMHHLKINGINNVVCTKIAFKLIHGPSVKSSLKDLANIYLNVILDKSQRLSDWSKLQLDSDQIQYAINDVKYLVDIWKELKKQLKDNGLLEIAQRCFDFLPTQAYLSNKGIDNIFKY